MRNQYRYRRPQPTRSILSAAKAAPALAVLVVAVGAAGLQTVGDALGLTSATSGECNIKGNISINSGERIYHVPGQEYYSATKISPQHGERWFCSEGEARAAGWRKARS